MAKIQLQPREQLVPYMEKIQPGTGVETRYVEYEDTFRQEKIRRSYEIYLPSDYGEGKKYPLLLTVSANLSNMGKYPWWMIGERDGFITVCVYIFDPGSKTQWNSLLYEGENAEPYDDVGYIDAVLDAVAAGFPIDTARIYGHGNSSGDKMLTRYVMERGERFAAVFLDSGMPQPNCLFDREGRLRHQPRHPVAVIRNHGSLDRITPYSAPAMRDPLQQQLLKVELDAWPNIRLWLEINECPETPEIALYGIYNILFYHGRQADLVYYSVYGGAHSITLGESEMVWREFLRGFRRENGHCVFDPAVCGMQPDQNTVALAEGAEYAYVNNRKVKICGALTFRELSADMVYASSSCTSHTVGYLPLTALKDIWPDLQVEQSPDGRSCRINWDGHTLEASYGQWCVLKDGLFHSTYPIDYDGQLEALMLPIGVTAWILGGYYSTEMFHTIYLTKRAGCYITLDTAYILQLVLGARKAPHPSELYAMACDAYTAERGGNGKEKNPYAGRQGFCLKNEF